MSSFQKQKKMPSSKLFWRTFAYMKPYKLYLIGAVSFAALSVALTLLIPVLIGRVVDHIVSAGNVEFDKIAPLCVYMLLCIAGVALFQWLMGMCNSTLSYRTVRDLRNALYQKLNDVPLNFIDTHPHGDIISRIVNDTDAVSDGLLQGLTQLFSGVITILGTLCFMLALNVHLALIVIIITPLSLLAAVGISRLSAKRFSKQALTQGELSGYVEEMLGSQKLIITFAHEDEAQARFEEINGRLYVHGERAQFTSSLANPSTRFVNTIVYTSVGLFGALSVIDGSLTVGVVSAFLTYANQYAKPFNEISGVVGQIQTAFAGARRVFDMLDEENQPPQPANAVDKPDTNGKIEMNGVSFSYTPKQNLITNFNLAVSPGQKVAIVGPTGGGKSTLINLLMRFYEVNHGTIHVDDTDISKITRNSLRKLYGMVLQESWLYNATIKENIAYGRPNATGAEIEQAAKEAYAHDFIMQTENGYNTVISDDSDNISSGQKQLLCIARVLLCNPSMLILDEATSNIDTLTEARVQKAFVKMMQGKTSFIVAHRLSTIVNADVILVLKDGDIIEQGSHKQLLEKKGFYHKLFYSQFAPS